MDIYLQAIKKGFFLFLNYKILIGSGVIVSLFFLFSFYVHWPREKESRILKAIYTSGFHAVSAALFVIAFFPLFFNQAMIPAIEDLFTLLFAFSERIVLAGFLVFMLSMIPFLRSVLMDLPGLQFYFVAVLIFNACIMQDKTMSAQMSMVDSLIFLLLSVFTSAALFYLLNTLLIFVKGLIRTNIARTVALLGGILSFLAYTQMFYLRIVG